MSSLGGPAFGGPAFGGPAFGGSAAARGARLLGVALLVYALLSLPSPASAAPDELTLLQFNLCGNACGTHLAVVGDLERQIRRHHPQPFLVTLNEVCRSQYDRLVADLRYGGHFEPTVRHRCWDGSDYGIAILVRSAAFRYLGSWPLPNPGGDEPRAMSCLRSAIPARSVVGCVTHLDTDPLNTPGQVAAVAAHAGAYWPGDAVVVGGDFNTTPGDPALDAMYDRSYRGGAGVFTEAGSKVRGGAFTGGCAAPRCGARPGYRHPTRKIDYLFLSRADFTASTATPAGAAHSDHTPLWATATLVG